MQPDNAPEQGRGLGGCGNLNEVRRSWYAVDVYVLLCASHQDSVSRFHLGEAGEGCVEDFVLLDIFFFFL